MGKAEVVRTGQEMSPEKLAAGLRQAKKPGLHDDRCASRKVSGLVIRFEDKGQDMLRLTVNAKGKVVDSDLQQWLWVGCKLRGTPITGEPLTIALRDGQEAETRYNVLSVEPNFYPCNCPSAAFTSTPKQDDLRSGNEGLARRAHDIACACDLSCSIGVQWDSLIPEHKDAWREFAQKLLAAPTGGES